MKTDMVSNFGDFYPRSPCGERRRAKISESRYKHFYPRSPCGERQPGEHHANSQQEFLSTLSLRRATQVKQTCRAKTSISIHALLAESDSQRPGGTTRTTYFYPRSPCGERRWLRRWQLAARDISIHALLAESDHQTNTGGDEGGEFLSTLSLRRATQAQTLKIPPLCISIHALLAESDGIINCNSNFFQKFLSTLSLRRATSQWRTLASGT